MRQYLVKSVKFRHSMIILNQSHDKTSMMNHSVQKSQNLSAQFVSLMVLTARHCVFSENNGLAL